MVAARTRVPALDTPAHRCTPPSRRHLPRAGPGGQTLTADRPVAQQVSGIAPTDAGSSAGGSLHHLGTPVVPRLRPAVGTPREVAADSTNWCQPVRLTRLSNSAQLTDRVLHIGARLSAGRCHARDGRRRSPGAEHRAQRGERAQVVVQSWRHLPRPVTAGRPTTPEPGQADLAARRSSNCCCASASR